jgi:hypothetical protein
MANPDSGAGEGELEPIVMLIRMSVPPPDMCVFLRYMLPAMNPDERTSTSCFSASSSWRALGDPPN